jgi:hypothetical protein
MVSKNIVKWCAETLLSNNSAIYVVVQVFHLQPWRPSPAPFFFASVATKQDDPSSTKTKKIQKCRKYGFFNSRLVLY